MAEPYKTIDAADLAYFRSVAAEERVIPGEQVGEDYCHDELAGIRKRPEVLIKAASAEEVSAIMGLLKQYMLEAIDSMERDQIRLRFLGDLSAISPELQALVDRTNAISEHIRGFQANVCLNYGGRDEILHAARECAAAGEEMTEENFSRHLYSAGIPDPDLIIRPSGELRLSNFLLWQCAYSEFYFCDTLWPDFSERSLDEAIIAYQKRDRRFGGVK